MPPQLPDVVLFAVPFFVLSMALEVLVLRRRRGAYELRDTAASLTMGLGNLVSKALFLLPMTAVSAWAWEHRAFTLPYTWWTFVLLFIVEDFIYYWFHRLSHEHRIWWAAHVNHHSSQHYNLSTALRQTWTNGIALTWMLWVPMVWLGFHPALVAFQVGVSLVYQFWIHTEAIGRFPAWIEAVFNTPSHHRVHHATNPRYLDANYAGILIVWDRLFGSFVAEHPGHPCRYGLTTNLATFNPWRIAFHEWLAIADDVRAAPGLRAALGYVFRPPGWRHDGTGKTAKEIRARFGGE